MRHEVAHMGIVYGGQCLRLPSPMRGLIIGKYADNINVVEIAELGALKIEELASEYEVKQLFAAFVLHADDSGTCCRFGRVAGSGELCCG
jgi:hypothetical protein